MSSGFLPQLFRVPQGINQRLLGDAGNKSTAGSSNLLTGTMKFIIRCNTASDVVPTKFIFQPSSFFEKSWLMSYCGVVTVTELDFGPRTLLTTAAIE